MINYRLLLTVFILVACLVLLGLHRLTIDTDVVRSLPTGNRVVADALDIFAHHPIHDQVAVDISLDRDDPDLLAECGDLLEEMMRTSGLFTRVGNREESGLMAPIALEVSRNLPLLFSREDLAALEPLLDPERIVERITALRDSLGSLEGIGQGEFVRTDPLGFKDRVLARMALLAPSLNVRMYRGHLFSADGRHLLVTARPETASTDTAAARKISALFAEAQQELASRFASRSVHVTLTPVGSYRAALDNERIIRHDVRFALILSTAGIALLLLLSFSRPLIGLLSLVPALAGTAAALFVYSLLRSSISIMVLGFGGAIISITVDHGIAYLLFLDGPGAAKGKEASRELKAVGMMAVVTTIVAFLILSSSGFPVFTELGLFTALGMLFSFVFVHTLFPKILPALPGGTDRTRPLQKVVNALYMTGYPGALLAACACLILFFFARPQFHVSLSSMNTVTAETERADTLFTSVWGRVDDRVYLMYTAESIAGLQDKNDLLLKRLERDRKEGVLHSSFEPSMIFPGRMRSTENLAAWKNFWDGNRREKVKQAIRAAGIDAGFTREAFAPFFALLDGELTAAAMAVPEEDYGLLGISPSRGSGFIQFVTLVPGTGYDAANFMDRYRGDYKVFDAAFFTGQLANILFGTFTRMLAIIAGSMVLLLLLVSLSPTLTALSLLPSAFAYVCTLGTLKLIGRPLDIPSLMLSIVILGMGIDYAIFCVRAHQRYRDVTHPTYSQVRSTVFLAAISTLTGFGVLCFAEHSLLRSIGITSFLGISYSLLGTFLLLPPLLNAYFAQGKNRFRRQTGSLVSRIHERYRTIEAYPRMFARFKLRFDPMFRDLPRMLESGGEIRTIADIGCGYGVPACWCLESFPEARVYGIDPDPERVRVASIAIGDRGAVVRGWAPEMPPLPDSRADVVLLLDMLHYLDDRTLATLVQRCRQVLVPGGILVMRFTIVPPGKPSWSWRLENSRIKAAGWSAHYRAPEDVAALLEREGFRLPVREVADNPELAWLVGRIDQG